MAKLRVASLQASGVAWVPWRVKRLLAASDRVRYEAFAAAPGMERYGLPEIPVEHDVVELARRCDVLHLHHACVAGELIAEARAANPRVRVVVTVHGEPDRTLKRRCINPPDVYHVVEPLLRPLFHSTLVPALFVPNHPALPKRPTPSTWPRPRVLYVPFSHVAQFKDHDLLAETERVAEGAGWAVRRATGRTTNAELLVEVARAAAVWVQAQGYFDLLTMECWSLGALPVVGPIIEDVTGSWTQALRFQPRVAAFPMRPGSLIGWNGVDTIAENAEGMRDGWNEDRARADYEELFLVAAGG